MTIKSGLKFLLIFSVLTFYTACKSYTIPYDKSLEGKTISTGFYVSEVPVPSVRFNNTGLGALVSATKEIMHTSDITKAYTEANLREIIYEEFLKNGSTISPKIKTSIKSSAEKELVINQVDEKRQSDPKVSEFIFEGIPEQLGKDYIFTIKILDCGMVERTFSASSQINYVASIINMKTNTKVWQMQGVKESSFPFEFALAFLPQKDSSKVKSNLRDCVVGIIQDISANINSSKK